MSTTSFPRAPLLVPEALCRPKRRLLEQTDDIKRAAAIHGCVVVASLLGATDAAVRERVLFVGEEGDPGRLVSIGERIAIDVA